MGEPSSHLEVFANGMSPPASRRAQRDEWLEHGGKRCPVGAYNNLGLSYVNRIGNLRSAGSQHEWGSVAKR
jgi:hypothetical protein